MQSQAASTTIMMQHLYSVKIQSSLLENGWKSLKIWFQALGVAPPFNYDVTGILLTVLYNPDKPSRI